MLCRDPWTGFEAGRKRYPLNQKMVDIQNGIIQFFVHNLILWLNICWIYEQGLKWKLRLYAFFFVFTWYTKILTNVVLNKKLSIFVYVFLKLALIRHQL